MDKINPRGWDVVGGEKSPEAEKEERLRARLAKQVLMGKSDKLGEEGWSAYSPFIFLGVEIQDPEKFSQELAQKIIVAREDEKTIRVNLSRAIYFIKGINQGLGTSHKSFVVNFLIEGAIEDKKDGVAEKRDQKEKELKAAVEQLVRAEFPQAEKIIVDCHADGPTYT